MTDVDSSYKLVGQQVIEEVLTKAGISLTEEGLDVTMEFKLQVQADENMLVIEMPRAGKPPLVVDLSL